MFCWPWSLESKGRDGGVRVDCVQSLVRGSNAGWKGRGRREQSWDILHFLKSSKVCTFIKWSLVLWAAPAWNWAGSGEVITKIEGVSHTTSVKEFCDPCCHGALYWALQYR